MKTKYVLMNDDDTIIAIFNNLADAEEYCLSLVEESAYNFFCGEVQTRNWTLNDYISDLLKRTPRRLHTLYMRALWENDFGLWIRTVKELD